MLERMPRKPRPPARPSRAPAASPPVSAPDAEAAAVWLPVAQLRPWAANPRKNDPAVASVAQSIKRFGFGAPIIARSENLEIIAGHTRLKAAIQLGLDRVPVRLLDLDPAEAHLLALADNRLNEKADWLDAELASILASYSREDAALAGWDDKELAELLDELDDKADESHDDEEPPAPPAEPITQEGDLWELGPHRLLCGDSTKPEDVDRARNGFPVQLIVTDPPFAIYGSSTGIGADIADDKMVRPFFEALFKMIARIVPDFAHVYAFCDWRSWAAVWDGAKRSGLSPKNMLVWDKGGGLGAMYQNSHELVAFFSKLPPPKAMKSGKETGERCVFASNILKFARVSGDDRQHNAAKPVDLIRELVKNSSNAGDTVADLFNGSGSTLLACEREGRNYVGLELEPKYCDITVARWEKLTGKKARRVPRAG